MHLYRISWWQEQVIEELLHLKADRKQSRAIIGRHHGMT
jgi:hypothetical protein